MAYFIQCFSLKPSWDMICREKGIQNPSTASSIFINYLGLTQHSKDETTFIKQLTSAFFWQTHNRHYTGSTNRHENSPVSLDVLK